MTFCHSGGARKQKYFQQQHAELNEMMVKSISSKPVKPRQPMNAYDYHRLNHNPPSRLRNQRPSTTQTQRDRDNILRRTKNNRRLEPLNRLVYQFSEDRLFDE